MRLAFAFAFVVVVFAAGCADSLADCPGGPPGAGSSCSAAGLTCYYGAETCACTSGAWQCGAGDLAVPQEIDHGVPHDLASTD